MRGTHWMITGGAMGIGRCVAQFAAQAGANLSILDQDEEAGRDTVRRLKRWAYERTLRWAMRRIRRAWSALPRRAWRRWGRSMR